MKDQCEKESCGSEECKEECSGACEDGMINAVLSITQQAWGEVLKDKIKNHYEKSKHAEFEEAATLAVKALDEIGQGKTSAKAALKAHLEKMTRV